MPTSPMTSHDKSCHVAGSPGPLSFDEAVQRAAGSLRFAFSRLVADIAGNPPPKIMAEADSSDIEQRAEHIQQLLLALEAYLSALLTDTKRSVAAVNLDIDVLGILSDTQGDLVGTFKAAAEQMREIEREIEMGKRRAPWRLDQ